MLRRRSASRSIGMQIESPDFKDQSRIPGVFALAVPDPKTHIRPSENRNPGLRWRDVPGGTRTLVLLCVDPDAPTRPDDVNKEGRVVPRTLPRANFYHWALVDVPPTVSEIRAGVCCTGITAHGKQHPPGPVGSRQGLNDYTGWFAGDVAMQGQWFGYDGPCPPWNDELLHHYNFVLYATDLARCPVEGAFTGAQVEAAIKGHVLAEARLTGTYSLNPGVS
jgi:Raf kinase inhibitor-like YbhB/YbcL family protein